MKNWTIGKRLAATSVGSVAIVLLLGIVSWASTNKISKNVRQITDEAMPELNVAGDIRYQAVLLRVTNFKHVLYPEPSRKDELEKQAGAEEQELTDLLNQMEKHVSTAEQGALCAPIKP